MASLSGSCCYGVLFPVASMETIAAIQLSPG
jgi:hypothetical protein